MKDEIKLKDMTDFLENVYKDIKKQPTLEEELEKERKFINKIKGDNEDEVKELLEHIEILDNTDYILHSDKAKALLNYTTNLQEALLDIKEYIKDEVAVFAFSEVGNMKLAHWEFNDDNVEHILDIVNKAIGEDNV